MANVARFSYTTFIDSSGERLVRPIASVSLAYRKRLTADALLDTGADANVLPYQLGIDLGANWEDAQRCMEESVALEPKRIVHHLDLGRVYTARDDRAKAREQYEAALRSPATEYNDARYKSEAAKELEALR